MRELTYADRRTVAWREAPDPVPLPWRVGCGRCERCQAGVPA